MSAYVFEGHIVTGEAAAINRLSELLTRLRAFEAVTKDVPGYPSLIEMAAVLASITRPPI